MNANDGTNSAFGGICILPVNPSRGLYGCDHGGKGVSLV